MATSILKYLLLLTLTLSGSQSLYPEKKLIWSDEFNGSNLDTSKWSIQLGTGCPTLCGWGNNESQFYTDREENILVSDGYLKIIAQEEFYDQNDYTSARIRSLNKGDWTYGRFEARIKLPFGKGIWPAFWMLPSQSTYGGWPKSGEIDIMECVGHESQTIHGTIHYESSDSKNKHSGKSFTLDSKNFADDFHVFAIDWNAEEIKWYVDDLLFSSIKTKDIATPQWPFDQDFHFLLNLAVGGNWPGYPDSETEFPQEMVIDYVRVYQ